jgi:CRP-like cAMP-binding protein
VEPVNHILRALPLAEFRTLLSYSHYLDVSRDLVLLQPRQAVKTIYFPATAVISVIGETGDGGRVELWSVGCEGVAGIAGVLGEASPYRKMVQVAGQVLASPASMVRKQFRRRGALHDEILKYYENLVRQIAQLGICNSTHQVAARLSRWLLLMQDRTGLRTLEFTQDFIAGALGTRRATISEAAAALQSAQLIRYMPGSITIRSRRGLIAAACGCYRQIRRIL